CSHSCLPRALLSSRDHRDLNSFPTRRSSDLVEVITRFLGRHGEFRAIDQRPQIIGWNRKAVGEIAGADLGEVRSRQAAQLELRTDRKSTRLNSSHVKISYAVFCLNTKNQVL